MAERTEPAFMASSASLKWMTSSPWLGSTGRLYRLDIEIVLIERSAARYYASLKYVDPKRLGIWGWSFGREHAPRF